LGKYENQELYLKTGRYGPYVEWGEKKESIKSLQKPIDEVGIEDILAFLENKAKGETMNILRVLNPYMSVRKGKFGAYVFFQKPGMKTPKFLNIKKFPEGFLGCDPATLVKWCCDTYQITI
jgi:topoisomerase IA-like protein